MNVWKQLFVCFANGGENSQALQDVRTYSMWDVGIEKKKIARPKPLHT